jgi:multidrug efflux pump subunit AcrA (membrane-fusion protein)
MQFLAKTLDYIVTFISNFISSHLFKNRRRSIITLAVLGISFFAIFFKTEAPIQETPSKSASEVSVEAARTLGSDTTFTAVGTATAVSEAKLQTESGGRIVGVYAKLGNKVRAGSIIAKLESASESAVLLQAQGSYESALAGAASGNIGITEAENGLKAAQNAAVNTYKSTYTSVSGILYGTIDEFFADPNSTIPGVRISSSYTAFLNSERIALRGDMPIWKNNTLLVSTNSDLDKTLDEAETITNKVLAITDAFIDAINKQNTGSNYTEAELRALGTKFNGVRAGLVGNLASIDGARVGLTAATESLNRAKIAGTSTKVSASGAQIKQALGALRSAQANYEKTIVRTPISGTVNALYLKAGEYASPSQPAAIIANNNNGLEITTSASQEDTITLKVGDAVLLDKTATGTITAIGGAVDPTTGKVAIKINVDEQSSIKNGSTVSVSFIKSAESTEISEIVIPLSAIKMTGAGPTIFIIDESSKKLVSKNVTLGTIRGENVVVAAGLDLDTAIVVDARGLKEGLEVIVKTK